MQEVQKSKPYNSKAGNDKEVIEKTLGDGSRGAQSEKVPREKNGAQNFHHYGTPIYNYDGEASD